VEARECRSCGKSDLIGVLDLGQQPWCNDLIPLTERDSAEVYPLNLAYCKDCTLLQLNYTVPKEVMFSEHGYLSGMTKTLRDHFWAFAKENIHEFELGYSDLIVDIGGNDGTQLLQYKKAGVSQVVNVESAFNIAEISRENGIHTINEFFNLGTVKKHFSRGSVSLINAAGVFFHLEELHSVIEGIKYLLKKDGVLTVQCMYAGELVRNQSYDMIYHEHLCYYTLQSLMNLLSPYGLNVFDAYHSPIHSGSLMVKVCNGREHEKTHRFSETLEADREYNLSSFLRFADVIRKQRFRLRNFLRVLKKNNNKIYAYGAPAKGNTLLNFEGIDETLIDKAVEINELKTGYLLPKSNIPIEKEDPSDYPDYYLLLSHNFADEIIEKNKDLLDKGVKFIVPFPEIKIVSSTGNTRLPIANQSWEHNI